MAHARLTTAGLLGTVFGEREGEELFSWLRALSFMEHGPYGLFPHDLAREVIDADLRWRDPVAYREVHARVRRHAVEHVAGSEGREHERAVADLMFLHRANPAASTLWDWKSLGEVYADGLQAGDADAIVAMVERHEGAESAAIAKHWLERQPTGFCVVPGRVDESCWASVRRSLCTRPARTTSRAIPGHGRCGLTRSGMRRRARGTTCSSPGS